VTFAVATVLRDNGACRSLLLAGFRFWEVPPAPEIGLRRLVNASAPHRSLLARLNRPAYSATPIPPCHLWQAIPVRTQP